MLLEKVMSMSKKKNQMYYFHPGKPRVGLDFNIVGGVHLKAKASLRYGVETSGPVGFSCRFLMYLLYCGVYFHAISSKMAYRRFP